MLLAGLAVGAVLGPGIAGLLYGLPLIKQADIVQVWFAGQADFGPEQAEGEKHFRTARWSTLRPGDCTIEDAQITVGRDGVASFVARVKSKDVGDRYCVILDFYDHRQFKIWHAPRICTPFDLRDGFLSWNANLAIPESQYRFLAFALREDHC